MIGWSLAGPLLVGVAIGVVELRRRKSRGPIDLLTSINAVYFLCFCLGPIVLRWSVDALEVPEAWRGLLLLDQDSPLFLMAGLLAWVGYVFLVWGYFSGSSRVVHEVQEVPRRSVVGYGLVLLAIGGGSIFLYAAQIGGLQLLFETIMLFRAQAEPIYTEFAFLKTLSVLATGSSVLLFGAAVDDPKRSVTTRVLLAVSVVVSMLVLTVNAGRLMVIQFLLMFPLYFVVRNRAISWWMVATGGVVFLVISVLGHGLFDIFNGNERLERQVSSLVSDAGGAAVRLLLEFCFPWVNLAASLQWAGSVLPLRWFFDVPLAIAYLVPKRIFPVEFPDTISMEVTELMNAPFPADLLTFGVYSAYVPGALLVAFVFGRVARILENVIPDSGSPVNLAIRAAWIAYIGSRVMYGNPHHTLLTALPLLAASVVLLAPVIQGGRALGFHRARRARARAGQSN